MSTLEERLIGVYGSAWLDAKDVWKPRKLDPAQNIPDGMVRLKDDTLLTWAEYQRLINELQKAHKI